MPTLDVCLPAVDSESTNLNSSFPLTRAYTSKLDLRFTTLSRSPSGSFLGATELRSPISRLDHWDATLLSEYVKQGKTPVPDDPTEPTYRPQ